MLRKSTQRKLVAYLISMILLHAFFAFRSWRDVTIGMPDFTIFYTAGKILQLGQRTRLYDVNLQRQLQQDITPAGIAKRGTILPYNHPAFEAFLFLPLARFSYVTAYLIWLTINLAILLSIPFWLGRCIPGFDVVPRFLCFLAIPAFFPIFRAFLQGQDSILLLFVYCVAYIEMRRGRDVAAGSFLGLGLFKFHLILPFVVALIFSGRKRLLIGFFTVMASLAAITFYITGKSGVFAYPSFVWETEHGKNYAWGSLSNTINLRGLLYELYPSETWLRAVLLATICCCSLGAACWMWDRTRRLGVGHVELFSNFDLSFVVSIIATVLVSYHTLVHDWAILFLPVLILGKLLLSKTSLLRVVRYSICFCLTVLFFSPMYLMCSFRYQHPEIVAYPLLLLFLLLIGTVSALSPRGHATQLR